MNNDESLAAVRDALQLDQLDLLSQMVTGVMVVWALAYLLLTYFFLKKFRQENTPLWQEIGAPTLWRSSLSLYRFILSDKLKMLSKQTQTLGRLLRYMTFLGIVIAVSVSASLFMLYSL